MISISQNDQDSSKPINPPQTRSFSEYDSKLESFLEEWNCKKKTTKQKNHNDSISRINTTIPNLPKKHGYQGALQDMRGTRLPNNDLLLSGGFRMCGNGMYTKVIEDTYLLYSQSTNQWKEVGKMKMPRYDHSSVLLNGCVYSCGGYKRWMSHERHHEVFSLDGSVKDRKELPIALSGHTASRLNENQYMICGGVDENVSKECHM